MILNIGQSTDIPAFFPEWFLYKKSCSLHNLANELFASLLYRQWVADGRKIPLEEMIELATTLLEKGMKGYAK